MKKEIVSKRKALRDLIGRTDGVEELLRIGEDAQEVHSSIAIKAYRKAISAAKTGCEFSHIIEHLSYCHPDHNTSDIVDDVYDYGFLCDEAALAGAKKFEDQLKWRIGDTDEEKNLWDKSDIRMILDAIDEFLGNYLLIEKILNPDIKNDDYEWNEPGRQS